VLERIRNLVAQNMPFAAALEAVAANTVFTTHTPVPAGHDHFADDMVLHYFGQFCKATGLDGESLHGMGRVGGHGGGEFNMTALALRGSRFHNGVSRIHGGVSSRICRHVAADHGRPRTRWTTSPTAVHTPTFLATDWYETFDRHLASAGSTASPTRAAGTACTASPTRSSGASASRSRPSCCTWCTAACASSTCATRAPRPTSTACCAYADPNNPNVLTIGFARRFATYKRAALLFNNLDWLREILSDAQRPVLFIFAGKAHPADEPGRS
jgi:starch phosphorylase